MLPDSRVTVDRSTIARHLLGSDTDPFSRALLSADDLVPDDDLRQRLAAWRAARAASLAGNALPEPSADAAAEERPEEGDAAAAAPE